MLHKIGGDVKIANEMDDAIQSALVYGSAGVQTIEELDVIVENENVDSGFEKPIDVAEEFVGDLVDKESVVGAMVYQKSVDEEIEKTAEDFALANEFAKLVDGENFNVDWDSYDVSLSGFDCLLNE